MTKSARYDGAIKKKKFDIPTFKNAEFYADFNSEEKIEKSRSKEMFDCLDDLGWQKPYAPYLTIGTAHLNIFKT